MIAADLHLDGRPEIIVGYVEAPGVVYFNEGTGMNYESEPFGDGKGSIFRNRYVIGALLLGG